MSWFGAIRGRYGVTTDPLRTQRKIELVVLLLGLLLCLQLAYGGLRLATMSNPDAIVPAADSLQVPAVLSPEVVAAGQRNEILSRPLFWTSRRPAAPVDMLQDAEPKDDKATELTEVKLVGVFGGGDTVGIIALVKGEKQRILLGETIDGWRLESIQANQGRFVRGEKSETLTLERGTVAAAPAASRRGGSGRAARGAAPAKPSPGTIIHGLRSGDAVGGGATGPSTDAPAESEKRPGLGLGGRR
jgi:hypothetical protein